MLRPNSSRLPKVDNSGARVRELSAPLAAAGISILYQSSYMSDFIFVSTCNFPAHSIISIRTRLQFFLFDISPILIAFGSPPSLSVCAGLMYAGIHLRLDFLLRLSPMTMRVLNTFY